MAFANVRIRMSFRMPGHTWSEAHYRAADSITPALMTLANTLCDKRKLCLVKVADLHRYSVAAVQERRISQSRRKNDGQGNVNSKRDTGNVVQNVDLIAGSKIRNLALHGLPDGDVTFGLATGQDVSVASSETQAYLDYLTLPANGFQMRAETKRAGDPANPIITTIALDETGVKFSVAGMTLAAGDKIKISGAKGYLAKQFDGDWRVTSYAAGVITCLTTRRIDDRFTYIGGTGQVRKVDSDFYAYVGYTGWDPLSVESGTHKTTSKKK